MQPQAEKSPPARDNKEQPLGADQSHTTADERTASSEKETALTPLASEEPSALQGGDQASDSVHGLSKAKPAATSPASTPNAPSQTAEAPQPTAQPAGHGGGGKRRKNKQKQHQHQQQQPQGPKAGPSQEATASASAPQHQESPIVIQDQMQDVFVSAKNKNQIKAQLRKQPEGVALQ